MACGTSRGVNQAKARKMFALLARHVPERRANTGGDAVLTEAEFAQHEADYDAYITAPTMAIPGQSDKKLNKHAAASFVTMREAAKADGVALAVKSAFRLRSVAKKAAKAGDKLAVAKFSGGLFGSAVEFDVNDKQKDLNNLLAINRLANVHPLELDDQHAAGERTGSRQALALRTRSRRLTTMFFAEPTALRPAPDDGARSPACRCVQQRACGRPRLRSSCWTCPAAVQLSRTWPCTPVDAVDNNSSSDGNTDSGRPRTSIRTAGADLEGLFECDES